MKTSQLLVQSLCYFALALLEGGANSAEAHVMRIEIEEKQSPAFEGRSFGDVGQYEILTGKAYGELDPRSAHNSIITDIGLAPVNARGKVEYVATFTLTKPVNLAKAKGVMIYAVPNRGNHISIGAFGVPGESGEEFFLRRGFTILQSGWQGDLKPERGHETIQVPVAKNRDGSSITGPAFARFYNMPQGTHIRVLPGGLQTATFDTSTATLTRKASDDGVAIPIASSDWAFGDNTNSPFPGVPDAGKFCIRGGIDPAYLYELSFIAKDPLVLGIGFAATRDLNSYFRYGIKDSVGNPNPLEGSIKHIIGHGISQAGNFVKTFIHLGFNQDEQNRIVWDGANDHIAGRMLALNIRFANPGGAADLYEPGSEGTLWWSRTPDTARGRATNSFLDRSGATGTSPKIFETFGSTEFWGLRMSPGLVGTGADHDIALPANVRRYYFPGTTHGGGDGSFSGTAPGAPDKYTLALNTNPQAESMRALILALTDWVKNGTAPPPSQYPRLDKGELVWPNHREMGFPLIPGMPLPDGILNKFYDYDFGPGFKYSDLSGVMTLVPPVIKRTLPSLVPRVDADGNEVGGIPSAMHQAPLGTYLGWNVQSGGFFKEHSGGFTGGFIPFAKTRVDRLASGDPRLSLEERYKDHDGYVAAVNKAVDRLLAQHFLLAEDGERLKLQARESDVLHTVAEK